MKESIFVNEVPRVVIESECRSCGAINGHHVSNCQIQLEAILAKIKQFRGD